MYRLLGDPRESWPEVTEMPFWEKLKPKMNFCSELKNHVKNIRKDISDAGIDLLLKFFDYNPLKRISASEALEHKFFKEDPLPESNKTLLNSFKSQKEYHE